MPHCTPEQLALAALREPLPAADAAHLDGCARCRAEVASLQRGVDALAVPALAAPGTPVPPPPAVWAAIAAATGVSSAPRPEVVAGTAPAPAAAAPAGPPPPAPGPAVAAVTPLRPRRSRLLLAAAAALVVGAGIGAGSVALGSRDDDSGVAVAAAALDPLDDSGASGQARVVERDDGTRVLVVDLTAEDRADGFYEVWLIDEAVRDMVSVGVVQGGRRVTLPLPSGLDLGQYPVVDVSVEPLDGDPLHSGESVARGLLDT
ncbi:anti-sigma factor [Geodermatophilus sp. SYSU D00742]